MKRGERRPNLRRKLQPTPVFAWYRDMVQGSLQNTCRLPNTEAARSLVQKHADITGIKKLAAIVIEVGVLAYSDATCVTDCFPLPSPRSL